MSGIRARWLLGATVLVLLAVAGLRLTAPLLPGKPVFDGRLVEIDHPAGRGARLPRLAALPGGGAVLSWVSPAEGGHVLRVARYQAGRFGPPIEVARGNDWFVNWSDFPSVTPVDGDFWVAHWLARHPQATDVYHYGIAMAISRDGGNTWRRVGSPHADQTPAEHGFLAVAPDAGRAALVWLDGRANDERTTFSLRATHLDREGAFGRESVVDPDVCTCCWTALARTDDGLWAAYRGRTRDEVRDFQLRRHRAGQWSDALPLGAEQWQIAGCPTNGVSLAARGRGLVASWFTAAQGKPRVRAAFIGEGEGESAPGPVLDVDVDLPAGRTAVAWLGEQRAVVLHMAAAAKDGLAELRLTQITPAGVGGTRAVARVSAGRDSGVPQLLAVDDGLLVVWTESAPVYGIHTILVKWSGLSASTSVEAFQ
ncbi:MAG: hypothetical protein IPH23_08080 [Gammaproteobacteria bacterium]|nr:hypothetical protein [Gammaproteobacteria bacterium]